MPDTVDTSSYPKPTLPVSPLDIAGKLGGLQSQKLDIDQKKLSQANEALTYLTRAIGAIGPNGTPDQFKKAGQDAVAQGLAPQTMLDTWNQKIDGYKGNMQGFYQEALSSALQHKELIDHGIGQLDKTNTGANIIYNRVPTRPDVMPSRAGSIPLQAPPTAQTVDNDPSSPTYGQPKTIGQQPPPETPGFTNRLGVTPPLPPGPMAPSRIPGMRPGETAISATAQPATSGGFPTGLPPGVGEAEVSAGGPSGGQLAQDRVKAAAFQRDIFPLAQAIPALESLGTKGTGPGTETINHIKSFVLSNVPGVTEESFAGLKDVAIYDKTKKYLTDFVNQTGSSGTNDKLAAAFAGNPSVGISNAAAVDVAKSALSLRRMQQALLQEFETQKLPAHQYSRWLAKQTNETDPRAFGIDMMSAEAKEKLRTQLNKNPTEKKRFEESLNLAHNLGFITPSK